LQAAGVFDSVTREAISTIEESQQEKRVNWEVADEAELEE